MASAFVFSVLSGCDDTNNSKPSELRKVLSTKCSMDSINGDRALVVYADGGAASFSGWAVDSNSITTPPLLNIVLTGASGKSFIFEGAARYDRPDVVNAHKQDKYLHSGFTIKADISAVEKNTYSVSLQMPSTSSLITCKTNKVIVLK